jgi:hypothetical protein
LGRKHLLTIAHARVGFLCLDRPFFRAACIVAICVEATCAWCYPASQVSVISRSLSLQPGRISLIACS